MKIEKRDGKREKRILTAMIVDGVVCSHISALQDRDLFSSKWSNLVAGWCIDYFEQYGKPPKASIESMFEVWADKGVDKDTTELVERFLSSLSDEYKHLSKNQNSEYIIDQAATHFNAVKLNKLSKLIEGDLASGDAIRASERVHNFGVVDLTPSVGVDVLRDTEEIRLAFERASDPIIKYPGALGKFFGSSLERDGFISFMGPEKRGKTWWLMDVAWRAMLQRRRVAFFSVGDMSKEQALRRFQCRAARKPLKAGTVKYPTYISKDGDHESAICDFKEIEFPDQLAWGEGVKACQTVIKKTKTKKTLLKLACFPNSTMSVAGLDSILKTWERKDWIPDVVVIDYADLLSSSSRHTEGRDSINDTWKRLRALSQRLHCLVVTATQSDAQSYDAGVIRASNFSEDKRKLAHVTGMIGLNQTPDEKDSQVMRLNWIVLREGAFQTNRCVHVSHCFALGRASIDAIF